MRIEGKIALVTGASSGIGEAIARRFAAEGAFVYMTDIAEDTGGAIADEIGGEFLHLDVADEAEWGHVMAQIGIDRGRLDILVNNAGVISNQAIDETELGVWNRAIGVNLTGPMLGCRAAIEAMRANPEPGGSIVNIASTVSLLGLANDAAYTASKTGLLGLTRSIAAHCAKQGWGIRVNTLHPGTTNTAILQAHIAQDPTMLGKFSAMSPIGRMARGEEIAALALFLASDEASYCTGGAYTADGGLTAMHPTM